jgi:prepilin-type N-terminal cleavage/methylation domain-containing protein/prepilin-type processing-associated H-X9-DG protein
MSPARNHCGFSFIELMISMAVVLVLAAVVLGPTKDAVRKKQLASCAETLRKLNLSLALYANEHDGCFPALEGAKTSGDALRLLVPVYMADKAGLGCQGGEYAYAMGLKRGENSMLAGDRFGTEETGNRPAGTLSERGNHEGKKGNVLFADGHVEQLESPTPRNLRIPAHVILLKP